MTRKQIVSLYIVLTLLFLLGLRTFYIKHPVLSGQTMGTRYNVKISGYLSRSASNRLQQQIDDTLENISRQMSTWEPDSEITLFNESAASDPFPVSLEFAAVVTRALEFSDSTSGAFDPTLQPLLNLWGFGSEGDRKKVPTEEEIDQVWAYTGAELVWLEDTTNLWKEVPEVQLDLGAIAKGYGTDTIGRLLDASGFDNWFVEIGGEVAVHGLNDKGRPWSIGIQYPASLAPENNFQGILYVTNGAVATSGDYRNFIEQDGELYTHIIDPWTGQAILTNTASVTVFAPDCLDADAAATALFVLGAEEGLVWVEEHPEAEALFLLRNPDGAIEERLSSGFAAATGYISKNETP